MRYGNKPPHKIRELREVALYILGGRVGFDRVRVHLAALYRRRNGEPVPHLGEEPFEFGNGVLKDRLGKQVQGCRDLETLYASVLEAGISPNWDYADGPSVGVEPMEVAGDVREAKRGTGVVASYIGEKRPTMLIDVGERFK